MSEDLKIVISLKGTAAAIGIQAPDCDPVFFMAEGDLPVVMESVPGLVDEARIRWDANPRYPKCETKLEPPPAPARVTVPARATEEAMKPRLL